jgi:hypothetical protein
MQVRPLQTCDATRCSSTASEACSPIGLFGSHECDDLPMNNALRGLGSSPLQRYHVYAIEI